MSDKFDMSGRFFMSDKFDMSGRFFMSDKFDMSGKFSCLINLTCLVEVTWLIDWACLEDEFAMGDGWTGTIHLPSIHGLDRNNNFDK